MFNSSDPRLLGFQITDAERALSACEPAVSHRETWGRLYDLGVRGAAVAGRDHFDGLAVATICELPNSRFEFVERQPEPAKVPEPGLEEFLRHTALSSDASEAEIAFLQSLRFHSRRPTPVYYYRELQNLRDPLHFRGEGSK